MGLLFLVFLTGFVGATAMKAVAATSVPDSVNCSPESSVNCTKQQFDFNVLSEREERVSIAETIFKLLREDGHDLKNFNIENLNHKIKFVSENEKMLDSMEERLNYYWTLEDENGNHLSEEALKKLFLAEVERGKVYQAYGNVDKLNGLSLPEKETGKDGVSKKMTSIIGRENLAVVNDFKIMTAAVVINENGEMLLISSSDLKNSKYIIPKGGLENYETLNEGAERELFEEAGVEVTLGPELTKVIIPGKKGSRSSQVNPFVAQVKKIHHKWPENTRRRIWLNQQDAKILLSHNEHMVAMVNNGFKAWEELKKPSVELPGPMEQ